MNTPSHQQAIRLDHAIRANIDFITATQLESGCFESMSNETISLITFHTSLILLCLEPLIRQTCYSEKLTNVIRKSTDFILNQRQPNWSWTYWCRGTEKFTPPDFDDTACALSALSIHTPHVITGEVFAHISQLLIQTEKTEGGPYYTWIVPHNIREQWEDIDIVVNANILYFLNIHNICLPNLSTYIENKLRDGNNFNYSRYYQSLPVILYFISRTFNEKTNASVKTLVQQKLLSCIEKGIPTTTLETACMVCSFLRCNPDTESNTDIILPLIDHLLVVTETKTWKSDPCYIEEYTDRPIYSGSKSLTAAVIAESLTLYSVYMEKNKLPLIQSTPREEILLNRNIIEHVKKSISYISIYSPQFEKYLQTFLTTTNLGGHVTLLPFYFYNSLITNTPLLPSLFISLGSANLSGWLAYNIYDHTMDNDDQSGIYRKDLSLANALFRNTLDIYQAIVTREEWLHLNPILSNLDRACAWEQKFAYIKTDIHTPQIIQIENIPTYTDHSVLAEKSFGHALGPLTIVFLYGYSETSLPFRKTSDFFKHYLIARQLNDDAHDWLEDLQRGFFNSASVYVLKTWKRRTKKQSVNLTTDTEELQKIFWYTSMTTISREIAEHIALAREALRTNPIIEDPTYLNSLLLPIEQAAQKALAERKKVLEFLSVYK